MAEETSTLDATTAVSAIDATLNAAMSTATQPAETHDETAITAARAAENTYKPVFSANVRRTVYVVGLAVSFVAFVITGLSAYLPRAFVDAATLIGTGFGTLAAGFGVAYAGK